MFREFVLALFAIFLAATPALAGMKFAAYEGLDAIQEGRGGTKVTKDGVDFWTTGAPPRKYQVLGVLTDQRGTGILRAEAFGSADVAKKITALGGNAAVLADEETNVIGAVVNGGIATSVRRATTQILVLKYLD